MPIATERSADLRSALNPLAASAAVALLVLLPAADVGAAASAQREEPLATVAARAAQRETSVTGAGGAERDASLGSTATVEALAAEGSVVIDGFLDEEVWQRAQPVTDFRQRNPVDGGMPSERTEVRVAFDDSAIYFGVRLFDSEPHRIIARELHREGQIGFDDRLIIALDSYDDDRNAYIFELNALGTQGDALITDERLVFSDWNWEGVYVSEARITDEGWVLEVAIPLTTIRFNGGDPNMGVAFYRSIRRKNEEVTWPHIPQRYQSGIFQVSQYGTLSGLRDLRPGRNIEVKPFGVIGGQSRAGVGGGEGDSDFLRDAGVDVKLGLTSSLTLDLTVNTDFAQVESDNVQINLTRFNLFFPEKREFFLERAGLFTFGDREENEIFFSRRIGLQNDVLGGARLTGEAGPFSVGFLNLQTRDSEALAGANNTVLRLRTDPLPRTTLGLIFTNVQNADSFNRVAGIDGAMRFWSSSQFTFWAAREWSDDDAEEGNGAAAATLQLRNDRWGFDAYYTNIGENFDPGLGFIARDDMVQVGAEARFTPRFDGSDWARQLSIETWAAQTDGQDGDKESSNVGIGAFFGLESGEGMGANTSHRYERLEVPFFIRDVEIPIGEHRFTETNIHVSTNGSRVLSGNARVAFGGFFNGTRSAYGAGLDWKPSARFRGRLSVNRNLISLPVEGGGFSTTIVTANLGVAASRKLFGNALIQYDNFSQELKANLRINWIHTPGSDLFLVLDSGYLLGDLLDPRDSRWRRRTGVAKLTYLKAF